MSDAFFYFDFEGKPIERDEWTMLYESPARCVGQEWVHVRDRILLWVSTVWIGIDHNFLRLMGPVPDAFLAAMNENDVLQELDLRPWIFETMVFGNAPAFNAVFARPDYQEQYMERHATLSEAQEAHRRLVGLLQSGGELYE